MADPHDPDASTTDDLDAVVEPGDEAPERRSGWVDAALHGQRLDKAVVALAPEFSRTHLQSLIAQGQVRLDGDVTTLAARKLRAGQAIEVVLLPTAESRAFRA